MQHVLPLLAVVVGLAMGVAGVALGEADGAPGLQLLGLLLVLATVVFGVRLARRRS